MSVKWLYTELLNFSIQEDNEHRKNLEELSGLLPKVLETLKSVDQAETYMNCNWFVANKAFH